MLKAAFIALFLVVSVHATPTLAVQPDEVMTDPSQEARARALSGRLRCMVCQNQSIDDSDAPLARDLRLLLRERIRAGDSDAEVVDYLVARYGEFVLLQPRFNMRNALLWATPLLLLLAGGGAVLVAARSRRSKPAGLTAAEAEKLDAILRRDC